MAPEQQPDLAQVVLLVGLLVVVAHAGTGERGGDRCNGKKSREPPRS